MWVSGHAYRSNVTTEMEKIQDVGGKQRITVQDTV